MYFCVESKVRCKIELRLATVPNYEADEVGAASGTSFQFEFPRQVVSGGEPGRKFERIVEVEAQLPDFNVTGASQRVSKAHLASEIEVSSKLRNDHFSRSRDFHHRVDLLWQPQAAEKLFQHLSRWSQGGNDSQPFIGEAAPCRHSESRLQRTNWGTPFGGSVCFTLQHQSDQQFRCIRHQIVHRIRFRLRVGPDE